MPNNRKMNDINKTEYPSDAIDLTNEETRRFMAGNELILRKGLNTRRVLRAFKSTDELAVSSITLTITTVKSIQFQLSLR
jgi:hypothetical protein